LSFSHSFFIVKYVLVSVKVLDHSSIWILH